MGIWMLGAVIPPVFCTVGNTGWLGVLPAALICAVLCRIVQKYAIGTQPKWLYILELGWLTVLLALAARESGTCWEANPNAISVILIFLAALCASHGCKSASRAGAVLAWLTLPILGGVALAGATDINLVWVSREMKIPDGLLIVLLLIPCLTVFLTVDQTQMGKYCVWLPGAAAIVGAVLIEGTVGPLVSGNAFYEFSKSITLLGVAERFEALVACTLTLGWFALLSMILSAVRQILEKIYYPIASWHVWPFAVCAVGLMYFLPEKGGWETVGTLIFWVLLPVITQGIVGRKKV